MKSALRRRACLGCAGERYGTGLGSFFTRLLGETHLRPDLKVIETRGQHAVAVEIELAPVRRFRETVAFRDEELADDGVRRGLRDFHFPVLAARVVLQFAPRGVKRVTERQAEVLVLVVSHR